MGERVEVAGVALTHPERPLWPDATPPVTKLDLASYFEAMAGPILEHIRGRPCSILRAPGGVTGFRFLQRHPPGGGAFADARDRASGLDYLEIDTVEALVAAAQLDAVELHPWNCASFRPDEPGRLVFDLDPAPGVAFAEVVAAAHEVRARLAGAGLTGFCKTTGGKGLHVTAPVSADGLGWEAATAFARKLCQMMAADAPDRFLIMAAKSARGGRIFLDYLRNARAATAVAPWSPRAWPDAPVATPLAWERITPGLDPTRFTLRTVRNLPSAETRWDGYAEATQPLDAALAAVGRA